MIIQVYKTNCENCNEDVISRTADFTGDNEIIVDFIENMEFECACGTTTHIEINKYTD